MSARIVACCCSLLLGAASTLAAQEPADTAGLADIVVTSTAAPLRSDAIASAVTILDGEDLRARGVRFVHDALREVPGLVVVQTGSFGAVTSLFARGGESDYVKVLVDGVPANRPGGSFDFATLTTDNVQRIEIVRGPASVVHGSDAVAAVVQVVTRAGSGPVTGSASGQGGTFGSTAFEGSASGGGRRAGWSAGGSRFGSDGIYAFNSDFDNSTLSARFTARPDERTDASLALRHGWNTTHFPTDGSGVPSDSNQFLRGRALTLGAMALRRLGPGAEARVAIAFSRGRDEFDDRRDHPGDTMGFAYESTREVTAGRRSADARISLAPLRRATFTAGAVYELEHERQAGTTTSNFGSGSNVESQPPFDRTRHTWAPYVEAVADLPPGLAVNGGLRLDDNQAFGTFVTWRAGVAWRLATGTRLRASAGSAFKAPTFAENFADSPFEVGNPALEPERTRSWEVGADQTLLAGGLSMSAAWFDQRFRDLIQYVPAAPGAPTYENLGAANSRGVEAGLAIHPVPALSLAGSYTWLSTEVTDAGASGSPAFAAGERLLRRPEHSGRVAVTWRPVPRTTLGGALLLVGSRDDLAFSDFTAERVELPAYADATFSADIQLLGAGPSGVGVALLARLENAFDTEYETAAGYPGRGRTLFAGARVSR